jgi:hypothetical protein
MGGLAGHMSHIYEDLDLTFEDLKDLLRDIVTSNVDLYEKIDGQNLFVTYDPDAKQILAARNLTDARAGGVPSSQFLARWEGHPAEKPFVNGFSALIKAFNYLSEDVAQRVFGKSEATGKLPFLNLEIVCTAHPNLIQYDKNFLVFHSLDSNDREGFNLLVDALSGRKVNIDGEDWEVSGPRNIQINVDNSKLDALDTATLEIDELGMSDRSTIADFIAEKLRANVVLDIPVSTMKQESIINLVLGKRAAHTLADLKKGESQAVQKAISSLCTQENARKIRNLVLQPLEDIITEFSMKILDSVSSTLIRDHSLVLTKIRQEVANSIEKLKHLIDAGDLNAEKLLNRQMSKLKSPDNINSSMEGVVFTHPATDTTYKMTGSFAMANQLAGYAKRNSASL